MQHEITFWKCSHCGPPVTRINKYEWKLFKESKRDEIDKMNVEYLERHKFVIVQLNRPSQFKPESGDIGRCNMVTYTCAGITG